MYLYPRYQQLFTTQFRMKRPIKISACACFAALLLHACHTPEEEKISECAARFVTAYFNMDFDEAAGCCTPESEKWIAFRASNITSDDLSTFNAQPHGCSVSATDVGHISDSLAVVRCTVENAVAADSLEQREGRMATRRTWTVPLVKRNGQWMVKMEAPLQNVE